MEGSGVALLVPSIVTRVEEVDVLPPLTEPDKVEVHPPLNEKEVEIHPPQCYLNEKEGEKEVLKYVGWIKATVEGMGEGWRRAINLTTSSLTYQSFIFENPPM